MKHGHFDVIVVGGGHAGCEAAHAAARMGARVALVTQDPRRIGEMSCNPAVGGLGKGHIVREVDALDGLMGRIADAAGIQFRVLNRRKGAAVRGPRAQCDRTLFRAAMQSALAATPGLRVIAGEAVDLSLERGEVRGVVLGDGATICAAAVVLTTGTFLRGVVHIGGESMPGGRMGDAPATRLAARIESLGLPLGRLKTGTPPRLHAGSIDFGRLAAQPGDDAPEMFSALSDGPTARQVPCHLTQTTERTHDIVRAHLHESASHGGAVSGPGPRYCPSLEDKIVRFADKGSHRIFLEPEGLGSALIYPNGISMSLPRDVQERVVRSIPGLESARIARPGYAIEYDHVDPRALDRRLAARSAPGLFLAGQINGTTGYEEAAGQGLVAGVNAALAARGGASFVLDRGEAYIGVMIDDLVTRGVSEPYRMFTSRAEFRVSLRADNADLRLTPRGAQIGCVGEARRRAFERRSEALAAAREALGRVRVTPNEARAHGFSVSLDGVRRSAADLLAHPDATRERLAAIAPEAAEFDAAVLRQLRDDARYACYAERQAADVAALRREEGLALPDGLDWNAMPGLSAELREKLARAAPQTLGQAGRIDGMTPAALTLVLLHARRMRAEDAAA